MKKFQKLLGLCLIGSLLAVHPISGADLPIFSGNEFAGLVSLFFGPTGNGEGGNPQPPIPPIMMDGEEVSDEDLTNRIGSLCFGRSFDNPTLGSPNFTGGSRFTLTFNDRDSNKRNFKEFFEMFAPNNKERLQSCGYQLFTQAGFDLKAWESKDADYKNDKMYEFIIAHLMMKKIIHGFDAKEHFAMPDDTKLYCNTCYVSFFANEENYKKLFGDFCNMKSVDLKPAKS